MGKGTLPNLNLIFMIYRLQFPINLAQCISRRHASTHWPTPGGRGRFRSRLGDNFLGSGRFFSRVIELYLHNLAYSENLNCSSSTIIYASVVVGIRCRESVRAMIASCDYLPSTPNLESGICVVTNLVSLNWPRMMPDNAITLPN